MKFRSMFKSFSMRNKKDIKQIRFFKLTVIFLIILVYLTEEDIIAFLNATSLDSLELTSDFDIEKSKRFYHAIINKLIS